MENKGFERTVFCLAKQIKELRQAAGLSQEALAFAAGIDRTYVSQLERGVANPSIKILYQLSAILNSELEISLSPKPDTEK